MKTEIEHLFEKIDKDCKTEIEYLFEKIDKDCKNEMLSSRIVKSSKHENKHSYNYFIVGENKILHTFFETPK